MKERTTILRVCYWFGAILDGIMLFPMLSPKIGGLMFGIKDFNPGNEYRYAMMIGASLMAGWTILLLWADRKPEERKGIVAITLFPVVFGMIAAGIFAVNTQIIKIEDMIPTWILQSVLIILFGIGLIMNRGKKPPNPRFNIDRTASGS